MYITFKNQYLKELKKIHVCSKAKDLQKSIMEIKMKKQILNIKKQDICFINMNNHMKPMISFNRM